MINDFKYKWIYIFKKRITEYIKKIQKMCKKFIIYKITNYKHIYIFLYKNIEIQIFFLYKKIKIWIL